MLESFEAFVMLFDPSYPAERKNTRHVEGPLPMMLIRPQSPPSSSWALLTSCSFAAYLGSGFHTASWWCQQWHVSLRARCILCLSVWKFWHWASSCIRARTFRGSTRRRCTRPTSAGGRAGRALETLVTTNDVFEIARKRVNRQESALPQQIVMNPLKRQAVKQRVQIAGVFDIHRGV